MLEQCLAGVELAQEAGQGAARRVDLVAPRERFEVGLHGAGARVTIVPASRQGFEDDAFELGRVPLPDRRGPRHVALANELQRLVIAGGAEQPAPGGELVEENAGGEHVAAGVDLLTERLLGGHVRDFALDAAALGFLARDVHLGARLGDAEIDDLRVSRERDDHVLRRDVAMDDVQRGAVEALFLVRVGETLADADDDLDGVLERELLVPFLLHLPDDAADVVPVDVLHRDVIRTAVLPDVERLHDVRVGECGGDPRLGEEHLDEVGITGHLREDPLDDDHLFEAGHAAHDRQIELGHTARGEPTHERVLAEPRREGPGGARERRGQEAFRHGKPDRERPGRAWCIAWLYDCKATRSDR